MKIMSIVGARPNFMKIAPISRAIKAHNDSGSEAVIQHVIVHTGQHYDKEMSKLFFEELEIPEPHINLEVGSASHALQTAQIIERFEPVLIDEKPDVLIIVGDVNSTIACVLVAAKIDYGDSSKIKRPLIAHVEAGLRSFDRDMPEEINRMLTDSLSDFLFITEEGAFDNLQREGVDREKIHFVGNVMIDTLIESREKALSLNPLEIIKSQKNRDNLDQRPEWKEISQVPPYGLVTLHRPSNVDKMISLEPLIRCLIEISERIPLIFPLHPRTKSNLIDFKMMKLLEESKNMILIEPVGYLTFLNLLIHSKLVLTDSGGIQEESTYLNVPCITLRNNTERPVTVNMGTNYLVGTDTQRIVETVNNVLNNRGKEGAIPPLWDGKASARIISCLVNQLSS